MEIEGYKFRVDMDGSFETFQTLEEAFDFIQKNWKGRFNEILGTTHVAIRLFSERNVITEKGFQIGAKNA